MDKRRVYLFSFLVFVIAIACACPGTAGLPGFGATRTPTKAPPTATRIVPTIPAVPTTLPTKAGLPTPTRVGGGAPVKSPFVQDVVLAQGVQGDRLDPVNPTLVFAKDATIHAVVKLQNAPAKTQVTATWFVVDVGAAAKPNTEIDETVLTSEGTRNLDFTLKPTTVWPLGSYMVEISINGVVSNRVTYTVK